MAEPVNISLALDEAALEERVDGTVLLDRASVGARVRGARVSLWRSRPRRHELTDGTAAIRWDLRCGLVLTGERSVRSLTVSIDFADGEGVQVAAVWPVSGTIDGHEVRASGPKFPYARWVIDTTSPGGLDADHRLALLATVPEAALTVPCRMTTRTEVSLLGLAGLVPLVGRRAFELSVDEPASTTG